MKKEFVGMNKIAGLAVIDAEITARMRCKCGKESDVVPDICYTEGYYADEGDVVISIMCPHCHACYETRML